MSPNVRRTRAVKKRRGGIHPLVIAAASILTIAAITYYAFSQSLPFQHRFTLYALVNNSVNVRSESPVRIAGIDVGVVSGVSPAGNASKVTFTMNDSGLPVHSDATIRIRDRLFLEGGYYLELDPGSPSAPIVHDGFTVPQSQTATPVQFFQVLSTFDVASRASLKQLLGTLNEGFSPQTGQPLAISGAGGLKRAVPQLTPLLKDIAWVTHALRGTRQGDVQSLLDSASNVIGTLAGSSPQLSDLVTNLNRTSTALASTDGALGQSVAGLDQTLQVAPPALSAIDRALPPLAALAVALDPSLKVAPPIIDGVTNAVTQLASVVAPVARGQLLTTLKTTFTEFPTILKQLTGAFPITKQVSDCLRTHVVPVFKAQIQDGALSTGRPVWQDFVHFLPTVAGASGSFDANGHYTRVLAGGGNNSVSSGTLGILGKLPLIGQIVGSSPPGGGSLLGARPSWVGDMTSANFRPDVPCASQRVPSLAAPAAASDLRSVSTSAPKLPNRSSLLHALARGTGPRGAVK